MPLEPPGFSQAQMERAVATVGTADVFALAVTGSTTAAYPEPLSIEHSPPDRQALHSTFLI